MIFSFQCPICRTIYSMNDSNKCECKLCGIVMYADSLNDIIGAIERIRSRNNKNWMDILRLAFKYAPDEAKKVMADISECDAEINKLSKQLAEGEGK